MEDWDDERLKQNWGMTPWLERIAVNEKAEQVPFTQSSSRLNGTPLYFMCRLLDDIWLWLWLRIALWLWRFFNACELWYSAGDLD